MIRPGGPSCEDELADQLGDGRPAGSNSCTGGRGGAGTEDTEEKLLSGSEHAEDARAEEE